MIIEEQWPARATPWCEGLRKAHREGEGERGNIVSCSLLFVFIFLSLFFFSHCLATAGPVLLHEWSERSWWGNAFGFISTVIGQKLPRSFGGSSTSSDLTHNEHQPTLALASLNRQSSVVVPEISTPARCARSAWAVPSNSQWPQTLLSPRRMSLRLVL